jgi:pimeloyl-ACP methyl ester carboxylesterase/DNA-binding CsgD family transcriptional regulator
VQNKLAEIGKCYALSPRQLEMLGAIVQTGSLRDAAVQIGVNYTSARNLLAELKAKLGVSTVPMMIGVVLDLLSDTFRGTTGTVRRHDLFNLSERQFAIARRIGVAKSRHEIAAALGVSEAVIDAEMKEIYLVMGVRNAGELVQLVAAAGGEVDTSESGAELGHDLPTATLSHAGRAIGYSDYGPVEAEPVLILHSTITSRAPPTRLVAALRAEGYRPLAIDRPGFGNTDFVKAGGDDPYEAAAHDVAALCAALDLDGINVIARGSGQAAVRLAQLHPALLRRVLLVNPTPAIVHTRTDRGPLGAVKRMFGRRPWAVEAMIRMLAANITPRRMHDGMLRSYRESPPDLALVRNDPQFLADYLRATHGFVEGKIAGYVAEQAAWGAGYDVAALPGMTDWRILQSRHFLLHEPTAAMAYWQQKLPDTQVKWVEEAGQMLAYSHPHVVVAALARENSNNCHTFRD